jgi:hypothetical protein
MDTLSLEGLGKAISEAIALRSRITSRSNKIGEMDRQLASLNKEIAKLNGLVVEVGKLEEAIKMSKIDQDNDNAELVKRTDKLNKHGVTLPLSEAAAARNAVQL